MFQPKQDIWISIGIDWEMHVTDKSPLLTVVIPTFGRPQFLERAVKSALDSAPRGDVEVVVVPNGPDGSWSDVLGDILKRDLRLKVHPIQKAHANAARNHGLSVASGKYVRFLDDDDFLFPEVAREQLEYIEAMQGEICSARVRSVDSEMRNLGTAGFTREKDFVCGVLEISSFRLPTGNVFLRSALDSASWDEQVPRQQDYAWMLHLASIREWEWVDFPQEVGVWVHHVGQRISSSSVAQEFPIWIADATANLHQQLIVQKRLNGARNMAIARAIWQLAHTSFRRHPIHGHRLASMARRIEPTSRPPVPMLLHPDIDKKVPWLWVEWAVLPLTFGVYCYRLLMEKIRGPRVARRL